MRAIVLKSALSCLFLCPFIFGLPARALSQKVLSSDAAHEGSQENSIVSIEGENFEEAHAGDSWRRIRFTVGNIPRSWQPAVFLGRLGDADEVYLNGVKIGGEGAIGDRFVTASKAERLYRFPHDLLRPGGENLLTVRVMNLYPRSRTFEFPVTFGDYRDLLSLKIDRQGATKRVDFVLFTFFFIWIEFCLFLYVKGMRSKEYISFGIFMLLYSSAYFLDSLTFYDTGSKTFLVQKIILSFYAALPAVMLCFMIWVFHEKLNVVTRCNIFFALILSASAFFVKGQEAGLIFIRLWLLSCVSSGLAALFLAISVYRRKLFESGTLLASLVWLCLAGSYSIASRTTGLLPRMNLYGHYLSDFILLIWIISIKYGLIVRYARIKRSMHALSEKLLSAQEEVRNRLARDLHDSMGQNLAAVKFNLQRINKEAKNELIDGVIEEVSGSIKELRDIAAGLMPVSLRTMGLKKTIEFYAEKFSEKTGIKVRVDSGDMPRTSPEIELHLFRVFQETVNNSAKHSGATIVDIALRHGSPRLVMEIRDNGCGFDYHQAQPERPGMGLSIMAERMRVVGGDLTVTSAKGKGTTIRAEAPVR